MRGLTLLALSFVLPSAHAVYSPFDCRAALTAHVIEQKAFARWSRLGDLDSGGEATLLIRARGADRGIAMPIGGSLNAHPELSFTWNDDAYAVVRGTMAELQEQKNMLTVINGGRQMDFQVLERDDLNPTTLGAEIARRLPAASYAAKPLRSIGGWLARFTAYRRVRDYVTARTEPTRTRLAQALRARRNPRVAVSAAVLSELRECHSPGCVTPVSTTEDMTFRRLEAFFAERAPGVSLRQPLGLEIITRELMDQLAPELYAQNAERVARRRLNAFDLNLMSREARMFYLMRAYELIEERVWPGEAARPFIMFNIERTLREFGRIVSSPRAPRKVSVESFDTPLWHRQLADPEFERLRRAYPLTIVRGAEDYVWAVVPEAYAREHANEMSGQVMAALGQNVGASVIENLRVVLAGSEPSLIMADYANDFVLRIVAHDQRVARMTTGAAGPSFLVIPASLRPRFRYPADLGWDESRAQRFEEVMLGNLGFAHREIGGGRRQIFFADDEALMVGYDLITSGEERPVFEVTSLSPVDREDEVPFYRRIADRYGVQMIDLQLGDQRAFVHEDKPIRHVRMDRHNVVESRLKYGTEPKVARAVLDQMTGSAPIDDRRCAVVGAADGVYEVCFGSIINGFGKIKSVRRK